MNQHVARPPDVAGRAGFAHEPPHLATSAAAALVLALGLTQLAVIAGWLVGLSIGRGHLAVGVVGAGLVLQRLAEPSSRPGRSFGEALLLAAGVLVIVTLGALPFSDVSWDGMAYHLRGAALFLDGFNPLRGDITPHDDYFNLINAHYAQGGWMLGAALGAWTTTFESTIALGPILLVATLMAFYGVARVTLRWGPLRAAGAALATTGNTVAMVQLGTAYVDGPMASTLTLATIFLFEWSQRRRPQALAAFAAALGLLLGFKVSAVLPVGGLLAALALLELRHGRRARALLVPALCAVATLPFLATPYLTNQLRHGHPFWPVYGAPASHPLSLANVIGGQAPNDFLARGRLEKFGLSLTSRTRSQPVSDEEIRPKWPFTVSASERAEMVAPDLRIAGFGPLFLPALLLALALGASAALRRRPAVLLVQVALLAFTLLNPECWWARFVPWLWLAAAAGLLVPAVPGRTGAIAATALVLLLLANSTLALERSLWRAVTGRQALSALIADLSARPAPMRVDTRGFYAMGRRLTAAGIDWRSVSAAGQPESCVTTYRGPTLEYLTVVSPACPAP